MCFNSLGAERAAKSRHQNCSDSQFLKRLSVTISSKLEWKCHETLCDLSRLNAVTLRWVPEHRRVEKKYKADQLAMGEVKTYVIGP